MFPLLFHCAITSKVSALVDCCQMSLWDRLFIARGRPQTSRLLYRRREGKDRAYFGISPALIVYGKKTNDYKRLEIKSAIMFLGRKEIGLSEMFARNEIT